jgi:hypothetical protein
MSLTSEIVHAIFLRIDEHNPTMSAAFLVRMTLFADEWLGGRGCTTDFKIPVLRNARCYTYYHCPTTG